MTSSSITNMLVLLSVLVLGVSGANVSVHSREQTEDLVKRLRSAILAEVANGFSGSVVVERQGTTLIQEGFGAPQGQTISQDTPFWIASIGKQFTSAAVFRAQDLGLLNVNDDLEHHLPAVPRDKGKITIKQLLSHTSGLPQAYASETAESRSAAVEAILALPLAGKPGEKFRYSNENFQLAAALVEQVTQRNYWDFVSTELLQRARISSTGLARGIVPAKIAPIKTTLPPRLTRSNSWGQQGYFSTAPDLARWYRALQGDGVLSRAARETMFTPVASIQEGQTALGWFIRRTAGASTAIFTRGNEDFGANGLVYAYPASSELIVILTHAGNKDGDTSYSRALLAKLEDILKLNM